MRYEIRAASLNRATRRFIPVHPPENPDPDFVVHSDGTRTETIDTSTNVLFHRCRCPHDVECVYENWWNELNPESEEIIKVIGVEVAG